MHLCVWKCTMQKRDMLHKYIVLVLSENVVSSKINTVIQYWTRVLFAWLCYIFQQHWVILS